MVASIALGGEKFVLVITQMQLIINAMLNWYCLKVCQVSEFDFGTFLENHL